MNAPTGRLELRVSKLAEINRGLGQQAEWCVVDTEFSRIPSDGKPV